MPEAYKSYATSLGTTAATLIYPGSPGVTGTAIVNGINISNVNSLGATTIKIELNKSGVTYSVLSNAVVSSGTSLQALDAPIVLESGNRLFATAGLTGYFHTLVSAMEIT